MVIGSPSSIDGGVMTIAKLGLKFAAAAAAVLLCAGLAESQPAPRKAGGDLITKDLIAGPGKEVVVTSVEYPPGGSSPPHRHDSQVFVYVLEGHVKMQVQGGPLLTLGPGETFYESPTDIHTVSANASTSEKARFLAIVIKDKDKPITRQVK
jgi:quercetin dioxygenase-like cupin family protein